MFSLIINWGKIIIFMKSSAVIHSVLIYELLQTDNNDVGTKQCSSTAGYLLWWALYTPQTWSDCILLQYDLLAAG
jgi:hypothetical protein